VAVQQREIRKTGQSETIAIWKMNNSSGKYLPDQMTSASKKEKEKKHDKYKYSE